MKTGRPLRSVGVGASGRADLRQRARGLRTALTVLACCSVLGARARAEGIEVAYAGIGHLGSAAEIEQNYPITSQVLARAGQAVEGKRDGLLTRLASSPNPSFTMVTDRLASLKAGDTAIAFCLAIEHEDVSVETIGRDHKVLAELSAQALFFDFRSMSVVAAYPIGVQYLDVRSRRPTSSELGTLLAQLYEGRLGVSLLDEAASVLRKLTLRPQVGSRVQVRKVKLGDPALAVMPSRFRDNIPAAEGLLASQFAKFLSANQGVAVLPRLKGHVIGNKMAMRFSDGRVFTLKIPEADYVFDLMLRGFKKVETSKRAAGSTWVYGAYMRLALVEPLSSKVFLDLKLKNGESKVIPASQSSVDHWAAWQESLQVLLHEFTVAVGQPTAAWARSHATGDEALGQLLAAREVIESCR